MPEILKTVKIATWVGHLVLDERNRIVCYPSHIPKLYTSTDQARNSLNPGHRLVPCTITIDGNTASIDVPAAAL